MVERVELLAEVERVLCKHRQFQRANRLLDDFVEPRGLEDESPQLVRLLGAVRERRRAGASRAPSGRRRVEALAFLQLARRCCWRERSAYCRYGPLSPSKLRASSMSNAMTFPRENFTMK